MHVCVGVREKMDMDEQVHECSIQKKPKKRNRGMRH